MSVIRLNKITGLQPEKETLEEFQGPSKSLEEITKVAKNIKSELGEVEHYIEKSEERGLKQQLQEQIFKTKQEMVRLERMLTEQLEATRDVDVFADE